MTEVVVCSTSDVKPGSAIRVDIEGHRLAIVRLDESSWYAIGDLCTHAEASLSEGEVWVDECEIECPMHGAVFSLVTGEPQTLPATQPVPTYGVRVEGDQVKVTLP